MTQAAPTPAPLNRRLFNPMASLDKLQLQRLQLERKTLRTQLANAKNFNHLSGGTLGELMGAPLACLPSSLPANRNREIPMSEAEFDLDFGPEIGLIPEDGSRQQSAGLVTKLTGTGSPLAPFFMRAACLIIQVDPVAWAMIGAAVAAPAEGALPYRVPRVIPVGGIPDDESATPAVMEYNHQLLQGVHDLLLAYQFQYLLQGRFLMINERGMDVGLIDSHTCTSGFGNANADPGLVINQMNRYLTGAGSEEIFNWPNVTDTDPADGLSLEPNLVQIQYATPRAPGVFGVCYPVRPHVLFPGQNYQFLLSRINESLYYDRLRERWTTDGTLTKPSDNFADSRPANLTGPAAWAGYRAFRYGLLQYGVLLRGSELLPEESMQWLLAFGQPYQTILTDGNAWAQVQAIAQNCGLAGVPKPLGPRGIDPRWGKQRAMEALFQDKIGQDGVLAGLDPSDRRISVQDLRECLRELAAGEHIMAP